MVRAKKSLGQNFLVDPGYQRRIVDALELAPDDEVVEIGPGTGALTNHIVAAGARLVAVELDDDLAARLSATFRDNDRVRIVHQDALEADLANIGSRPADERKIVGNIPYNITSPLIFRLLEREIRPERLVLMVQKEVADRILAPAGEKAYGALSVGVRSIAHATRLFNVPRGAFRPVPDVDSTVMKLEPMRPFPLTPQEERNLRDLTRTAFAMRRKQFQKILRSAPEYALTPERVEALHASTGFDFEKRPESFTPEQFITLARALAS